MNLDLLKKIEEIIAANEEAYLFTVAESHGDTPNKAGAKMILTATGSVYGTIGGGNLEKSAIEKIKRIKPENPVMLHFDLKDELKMACGGKVSVLVEPLFNKHRLYIIGGGHCGMELGKLAPKAGFHTTVIDNRKEWATKDKHPEAHKIILSDYNSVAQHITFSPTTYIMIMTQNHSYDLTVAGQCLTEDFAYIGMLGSPNKARMSKESLKKKGFAGEIIEKIDTPAGININSNTPFEIAISILAQLIRIKNQ